MMDFSKDQGYKVTEFSGWYILITMEVMDCRVHANRKAIRSLFADLVTIKYYP